MSKIDLNKVGSGYQLQILQSNFDRIEEALNDEVMYRDNPPTEPNEMGQEMDMNSFRIFNLPEAVDGGDAVSKDFLNNFLLDNADITQLVERAEDAAESADEDATLVEELHNDFRDDYMGNGPNFPVPPRKDGSLFYYDGPNFTQGLYIHYPDHNDPFTGTWELVSGVGPQGPQGPEGIQGNEGVKGDQGIEGPVGLQGQQGIQGAIGDTGAIGVTGETGIQGVDGPQGVVGPVGDVGAQGNVGPDGPQGIVGPQGVVGPKGDQGNTGAQGSTGPTGPQGVEGTEGQFGPQGSTGPQGPIGVTGVQGPTGAKGDNGNDGNSFQIDEVGTFLERDNFDDELEDFTYYAEDFSVTANEDAKYTIFTGDGATTDFVLDFAPDGPQSIQATISGVIQTPDLYTIDVVVDVYTLVFTTAPDFGAKVVGREFSISTGFGAIFIKASDATADWGEAIPFGRGPRGDQGPEGVQGVTGVQGAEGDQGSTGTQGIQGPLGGVGPQGSTGNVGPTGGEGEDGPQGDTGITGSQGPVGIQGNTGPTGSKGIQGIAGINGPQGPQGDLGAQGAQGPGGDRGPVGIQGAEGERGTTGNQGPQGNDGATGPQGPQGITGSQGARGATGLKGPTGLQGVDGDKGPDGDQGIRGNRQLSTQTFGSWSASTAANQQGSTPVIGDISTQYFGSSSETREYKGGTNTSSSSWLKRQQISLGVLIFDGNVNMVGVSRHTINHSDPGVVINLPSSGNLAYRIETTNSSRYSGYAITISFGIKLNGGSKWFDHSVTFPAMSRSSNTNYYTPFAIDSGTTRQLTFAAGGSSVSKFYVERVSAENVTSEFRLHEIYYEIRND